MTPPSTRRATPAQVQATDAQLRLLHALSRCGGHRAKGIAPTGIAHEWSEVHSMFDEHSRTPGHLEMRNFDKVAGACERRGWITTDGPRVILTADGRAELARAEHDKGTR